MNKKIKEAQRRGPFTWRQLLSKAQKWGYISKKEMDTKNIMQSAINIARDYSYAWDLDEPFDDHDMLFAIKRALDDAGLKMRFKRSTYKTPKEKYLSDKESLELTIRPKLVRLKEMIREEIKKVLNENIIDYSLYKSKIMAMILTDFDNDTNTITKYFKSSPAGLNFIKQSFKLGKKIFDVADAISYAIKHSKLNENKIKTPVFRINKIEK